MIVGTEKQKAWDEGMTKMQAMIAKGSKGDKLEEIEKAKARAILE